MGGSRKRSAATSNTTSTNNSNTATSTSSPVSKKQRATRKSNKQQQDSSMWSSKSKKKQADTNAETMFQELLDAAAAGRQDEDAAEDSDDLGMEGIAALGEKLGLDVESDLRILVLLWKAEAQKPGTLTKAEWLAACKKGTLNVDKKWDSLKEELPSMDIGFLTGSEFKDFYKFCFQFNRQGTHRTLDRDLVIALLQLVLKDRVPADRLQSFCDFLNSLTGSPKDQQYSRITLDQWTSFWDFCVECEDLSNYDESTSAWPVLIDEYVEFMENKLKN